MFIFVFGAQIVDNSTHSQNVDVQWLCLATFTAECEPLDTYSLAILYVRAVTKPQSECGFGILYTYRITVIKPGYVHNRI